MGSTSHPPRAGRSLMVKMQRDRSFEVSSTMGRYIEMHLTQEHEGGDVP